MAKEWFQSPGGFFTLPDFVFDLQLSSAAFRIYSHLKCRYDLGQLTHGGVKVIALHCGISLNQTRRSLKDLIVIGLIEEVPPMSAEEACEALRRKASVLTLSTHFNARCEWCGSVTSWLQGHHHPIPRSEGGDLVVQVCSNCHAEFHSLTKVRYRIIEREDIAA